MKFRILLLSFLIYSIVQPAWAADTTLTPSISFEGQYDDNVSFERGHNKDDDFLYSVSPAVTLDYATEINKFRAMAALNYENYVENNDYNALYQQYALKADSNFTELLTLSGDFKYILDNTLETETLGTQTVRREDRQRYDLKGGLFLNLTELIQVGGDYRYRQTEYDYEAYEDYNDDTISFIYNQRLKNQLDFLSLTASYSYREVHSYETNTYRTYLGWTREFSETFSFSIYLGGRFTEQYLYDDESNRTKENTTGVLANIRFYKSSDYMQTELQYQRDQVYEINGGATEVDYFRVGLDRNLTERLKIGADVSLYLTRDVEKDVNSNSYFLELEPQMVYNLTEYHTLGIYYNYQFSHDEVYSGSLQDADRNRVWFTVDFNFPRKL